MAKKKASGTANIGFEEKLWLAADKLRGSMDAAEYKHTVLGLIFLKYISDKFSERREWLFKETADVGIRQSELRKVSILLPTTDVAHRYTEQVQAMIGRMSLNEEATASLEGIRDTLLPKLLSGELRIEDAEKFLGDAG